MLETIRDTEFGKLKSINHAFFTRKGGISRVKLQNRSKSELLYQK